MILLDGDTQKLQAVLAGAITTDQPEFQTTYGVLDASILDAYETNQGELNNTTDVDLVVGQASKQLGVKSVSVYNRDTVSVTVTFKKDTSATDRFLYRAVLAANESAHYEAGFGWFTCDANGDRKQTGAGGGGGAEVNDLTAIVTWANIPDANVPQSAVTQHEGAIDHDALANFDSAEHFLQSAISIPASQISDFDTEVSNNASVVANTAKVTNAAHTGDVTGATGLTIAVDAVTYAKMQNVVADDVFLGNIAGAGGIVAELTGTEATVLLGIFTDTLKGLAPLSGGGTTNFLRADGTWAEPPSGGGGGDKIYRIGHTYAISCEIKVPSGDDDFVIPFFVSLAAGQTASLVKARHLINAGTSVTCKLQKNGVDITGFTGITVNTTVSDTDPSDVTLADNDKLALVVTAVSGVPKNMAFTLFIEYTQ